MVPIWPTWLLLLEAYFAVDRMNAMDPWSSIGWEESLVESDRQRKGRKNEGGRENAEYT